MSADVSAMAGRAESLDHIGVAARSLGPLGAAYERLGFTLTPIARHSGRRIPDGPVEPFGTGNRCIMLRQGYLELIAFIDPAGYSDLVDPAMPHEGLRIVALGMEDEQAALYRLRRADVPIDGVAHLQRPVDDADPDGPQARFARLVLPNAPEGGLQLIRHLTPEAIWQERFMTHENGAVGLADVVLAATNPAETAARFSILAGRPVVPDPAGGFALPLPRGLVRILPAQALPIVYPGFNPPVLPFIAGFTLRTTQRIASLRHLFEQRGVPCDPDAEGGLVVDPAAAGGAALRFVAA